MIKACCWCLSEYYFPAVLWKYKPVKGKHKCLAASYYFIWISRGGAWVNILTKPRVCVRATWHPADAHPKQIKQTAPQLSLSGFYFRHSQRPGINKTDACGRDQICALVYGTPLSFLRRKCGCKSRAGDDSWPFELDMRLLIYSAAPVVKRRTNV